MAEAAKNPKRIKVLSQEAKKRKRESNKLNARTRINIGPAFTRWRELKDEEGCPTDGDLALLLLDYYQKKEVTSTPHKQHPLQPIVSSITEESDRDRGEFQMEGVQMMEKRAEAEEVCVLEASIHSLSIVEEEEHQDSPDEDAVNDPRNSYIEMDENWKDPRFCEDGDSSDEEYAPFLQLHVGGVASKAANIEQLQQISMDETVLDVAIPDPTDDELTDLPDELKVVHEDELIEKKACISYLDNLKMLTSYLHLPMKACNYPNRITGVKCQGRPPFQVEMNARGTGVVLEWLCPFGHILWRWNSQPLLKYGMQAGDFMLSTNILLSGNNYRKVAFLFNCMQMGMVAESTYFKIQDSYCIEPVDEFWQNMRAGVLARLREKDKVVLLGDGRMDSPGHCAQYCTYTTIEQESRDIVHIVSLDKRETNRNSVIMEKECFIRTMDALLPVIRITEVVTDAHTQISALLNPEHGKYKEWGLQHSLDIWHAAKSLGKKLRRAGTVREQSELLPWIRDIVNHFWYCAKQASSVEDFKMKWHAVIHHVRNQHTWATGACEHEPLDDDAQEKPWIKQGSAAHQALVAVVLDKRWLKDVKKFITFRTTSDLENFQNHILMYAGKRFSYTPAVYHTRTLLAAIDYNCHNGRLPARNKDGHKIYRRYYNKKSKSWSVYALKEKKDYFYIPDLQRAILRRRLQSGGGLPRRQTLRPDDPRRLGLLAPVSPPPTLELVRTHVTRGETVPQSEH
ncbi:uncharacterized protein LOC133446766 [Cololabis saira]|uniref:uncharacterized protein LOC133446766 n=1 Tax=Cololabis saira TaxID=129043 RepID=UPI002AD44789|nr:uncharacterized protein LOC133446766 [Cololabis saira]